MLISPLDPITRSQMAHLIKKNTMNNMLYYILPDDAGLEHIRRIAGGDSSLVDAAMIASGLAIPEPMSDQIALPINAFLHPDKVEGITLDRARLTDEFRGHCVEELVSLLENMSEYHDLEDKAYRYNLMRLLQNHGLKDASYGSLSGHPVNLMVLHSDLRVVLRAHGAFEDSIKTEDLSFEELAFKELRTRLFQRFPVLKSLSIDDIGYIEKNLDEGLKSNHFSDVGNGSLRAILNRLVEQADMRDAGWFPDTVFEQPN